MQLLFFFNSQYPKLQLDVIRLRDCVVFVIHLSLYCESKSSKTDNTAHNVRLHLQELISFYNLSVFISTALFDATQLWDVGTAAEPMAVWQQTFSPSYVFAVEDDRLEILCYFALRNMQNKVCQKKAFTKLQIII